MKISELPEPLKSKALEYKDTDTDNLFLAFGWLGTKETNIWALLHESKQITPEIVKEYYKNAKEVRCLYSDKVYCVEFITDRAHYFEGDIYIEDSGVNVALYDKEFNKLAEIVSYKEKPVNENTQPHYDNTHGSLYKVAEQRGWNSYQFDIVKRIDRALKKGQFDEDLKKTKDLIDLWSNEVNK